MSLLLVGEAMVKQKSLYLKYRPFQLKDVVGQKYVIETLKQASLKDEFSHSYLLSGNHGCGKTSTARILATLMTCENLSDGKICGKCRACKGIHVGASLDVKELDGATNRGIDDIKQLIDGAQWSPTELKRKVYIIDECLGKDSRVETDNGLIPISQIVNEKMDVKVRSYNSLTNQIEYKRVTSWHKNSGKAIYAMHFETLGALYAADNHKIMTPNGWQVVEDLEVGNMVCRRGTVLNEDQKQIALGSLMGDACVGRNRPRLKKYSRTNARLRFVHGNKQKEYLEWKLGQFSEYSHQKNVHENKLCGFAKKPTYSFNTITSAQFNRLEETVCTDGKKMVTDSWLNKLTPLSMAIWFCDDGSLNRIDTQKGKSNYVTLHTQGFSYEENYLIQQWLKDRWDVNASITKVKNGLFRLNLSKEGSLKFLKLISEYVPICMQYKLKKFEDGGTVGSFWAERKSNNETGLVSERITRKSFVRYESNTYDLEVQDNHNYFVSGTLVHNCHQLTKEATSALLKILEEPPSYLTFILCTTEIKKILPTILSRCQRFNFTKIDSKDITDRLQLIAQKENINIEAGGLVVMAKLARGSMRDAISYLEQVSTIAANKKITTEGVNKYFGVADRAAILNILKAILSGKIPLIMDLINDMIMASADTKEILLEITEAFRYAMLLKAQGGDSSLVDLPDHEVEELKAISDKLTMGQLLKLAKLFSDIEKKMSFNINERWIMEATLINCVAALRK